MALSTRKCSTKYKQRLFLNSFGKFILEYYLHYVNRTFSKSMEKEVCDLLYDKIKQLCNEKGTNIMRVEKEAGLSNATIRKWNESCPSAENLNAVAKVLNVTVDSLLNQKGAML